MNVFLGFQKQEYFRYYFKTFGYGHIFSIQNSESEIQILWKCLFLFLFRTYFVNIMTFFRKYISALWTHHTLWTSFDSNLFTSFKNMTRFGLIHSKIGCEFFLLHRIIYCPVWKRCANVTLPSYRAYQGDDNPQKIQNVLSTLNYLIYPIKIHTF